MTHTAVRHRTQAPSGGGAQEPDKNDGAPSFRGRDRSFFVTALFLSHSTARPPAGHPSLASKTDPKSSRLLRTSRDGMHPGQHSLLLAVLASDSSHCLHSLSPTKQAARPSKRCQPDDIIPCSEPSNGFLSHLMEVGAGALAPQHIWFLIAHLDPSHNKLCKQSARPYVIELASLSVPDTQAFLLGLEHAHRKYPPSHCFVLFSIMALISTGKFYLSIYLLYARLLLYLWVVSAGI